MAQDDDEDDTPQNVVKLNLGSIFLAHANVAYQRGFGKHFSGQIGVLYGGLDIPIGAVSQQVIGVNLDNPYIKSINYQGWGHVAGIWSCLGNIAAQSSKTVWTNPLSAIQTSTPSN
jgi:hypothetical protein